jgi:hypothetical protein
LCSFSKLKRLDIFKLFTGNFNLCHRPIIDTHQLQYKNKTIQKIRKSIKFTTKVKRRKSAPNGEQKKKQ